MRWLSLVLGCVLVVGALWFGLFVVFDSLSSLLLETSWAWLRDLGFALLAVAMGLFGRVLFRHWLYP